MSASGSPLRPELEALRRRIEDDFIELDVHTAVWADDLPTRIRNVVQLLLDRCKAWEALHARQTQMTREANERISSLAAELDASVGAAIRPSSGDAAPPA